MIIAIIAGGVIAGCVVLGLISAALFARLGQTVVATHHAIEQEKKGYNPALTFGHRLPVEADAETQLRAAKRLAAQRAAALPRGANLRIGRQGHENLKPASAALAQDPVTLVKIVEFHGWRAATGPAKVQPRPAAGAPTAQRAQPAAKTAGDLVPGKDYPHIEITDSMPPEEVRKARIANAKAKSAAAKALKAAGAPAGGEAPMEEGQAPVAAAVAAPPVEVAADGEVGDLVPGVDYQVIEITDNMPPEEVRKARIANSKARSAAAKARKAAGVPVAAALAAAVAQPATQPELAAAAPPVAAEPAPAAAAAMSSMAKPHYIEITDAMPPEAIRKARIENSKMRSAYMKELKAAGIDPATVGE